MRITRSITAWRVSEWRTWPCITRPACPGISTGRCRWRGGLQPSPREVLSRLAEIGADGLASRDRAILDANLVRELRERGVEIHVWTVDSARAARRLCDLGVDSIMTNRPGWLRSALTRQPESA